MQLAVVLPSCIALPAGRQGRLQRERSCAGIASSQAWLGFCQAADPVWRQKLESRFFGLVKKRVERPGSSCSVHKEIAEFESSNHRMVWVGRDLNDHLVPTPLPWAGTSSTRPGCLELHPTWPWNDDDGARLIIEVCGRRRSHQTETQQVLSCSEAYFLTLKKMKHWEGAMGSWGCSSLESFRPCWTKP